VTSKASPAGSRTHAAWVNDTEVTDIDGFYGAARDGVTVTIGRRLRFEPVNRNMWMFEIVVSRDSTPDATEAVLRVIHDFPKCGV
jgi:hypothetical protein